MSCTGPALLKLWTRAFGAHQPTPKPSIVARAEFLPGKLPCIRQLRLAAESFEEHFHCAGQLFDEPFLNGVFVRLGSK